MNNNNNNYLSNVLKKYQPKNLYDCTDEINFLKTILKKWANTCYIDILDSGSRKKGTAISIGSDIDYVISLANECNRTEGLNSIFDSLYNELKRHFDNVRKQNVSIRINLKEKFFLGDNIQVDITPARKHSGNTNDHSVWISKKSTWQKTNIHKHIADIKNSNRINEIKLLKIWREQNKLDFPSIYLEYLVINNLLNYRNYGFEHLENNFNHMISELAKCISGPLHLKITDPANTNNILSDLLTIQEKEKITYAAIKSKLKPNISDVIQ